MGEKSDAMWSFPCLSVYSPRSLIFPVVQKVSTPCTMEKKTKTKTSASYRVAGIPGGPEQKCPLLSKETQGRGWEYGTGTSIRRPQVQRKGEKLLTATWDCARDHQIGRRQGVLGELFQGTYQLCPDQQRGQPSQHELPSQRCRITVVQEVLSE